MLTTLIASRRQPADSPQGVFTSVAVHGVIIAAAILGTRDIVPPPRDVADVHPVRYVAPSSPVVTAAPSQPRQASHADVPLRIPDGHTLLPAPVSTPTSLPPVGMAPVVGVGVSPGVATSLPTAGSVSSAGAAGDGSALTGDQVERAVEVVHAVSPRYPELLRSAGITGNVIVRFVVGTDGRVEPESIEILESAREAFGEAVRQALTTTRYRPAEVGGRPVRQLVEQRFTFRVER